MKRVSMPSDAELMHDVEKPVKSTKLDNVLLMTGFPNVPPEKLGMFMTVYMKKVVIPIHEKIRERGIEEDIALFEKFTAPELPKNSETGMTEGVIIQPFSCERAAKLFAIYFKQVLHPFSKRPIKFHFVSNLEKAKAEKLPNQRPETVDIPDWIPPLQKNAWLGDPLCRSQFFIDYDMSNVLSMYYHPFIQAEPVRRFDEMRNADSEFDWSPQGTYLIHIRREQGTVEFFTDTSEEAVQVLEHPSRQAKLLPLKAFCSPCERFCFTVTESETTVVVWEILSGRLLGKIPIHPAAGPLRWSGNGSYLARVLLDGVEVFHITTKSTISTLDAEPKFMKLFETTWEHSHTISWSPSKGKQVLAVFSPKNPKTSTCSVKFVNPASMKPLFVKSAYGIDEAHMYWHAKGDFVAVVSSEIEKTQQQQKQTFGSDEPLGMETVITYVNQKVDIFSIENGDSETIAIGAEKAESLVFDLAFDPSVRGPSKFRLAAVCHHPDARQRRVRPFSAHIVSRGFPYPDESKMTIKDTLYYKHFQGTIEEESAASKKTEAKNIRKRRNKKQKKNTEKVEITDAINHIALPKTVVANRVAFSPAGRFTAFAYVDAPKTQYRFPPNIVARDSAQVSIYDSESHIVMNADPYNGETRYKFESIGNISWDPSGRHLASYCLGNRQIPHILFHSVTGRREYSLTLNPQVLTNFMWRPLPELSVDFLKKRDFFENSANQQLISEKMDEYRKIDEDKFLLHSNEVKKKREERESQWTSFLEKRREALQDVYVEERKLIHHTFPDVLEVVEKEVRLEEEISRESSNIPLRQGMFE